MNELWAPSGAERGKAGKAGQSWGSPGDSIPPPLLTLPVSPQPCWPPQWFILTYGKMCTQDHLLIIAFPPPNDFLFRIEIRTESGLVHLY